MAAYDVAVIGLGVMGAASLYRLAQRGCRVVGIERFAPGHDRGSSHGETRIIRLGYFEHPSYVPLLREAYALWRELETESGHELLTITGIVEIGPPEGELVRGTLASSKLHGLPHEVLTRQRIARRFPGICGAARLSSACTSPMAGICSPSRPIAAHDRPARLLPAPRCGPITTVHGNSRRNGRRAHRDIGRRDRSTNRDCRRCRALAPGT